MSLFIKWRELGMRRRALMYGKSKAPLICLPMSYFVVDVDDSEKAQQVLSQLAAGNLDLIGKPQAWVRTGKGVHLIWSMEDRRFASVPGDARYTFLAAQEQHWPIWALDKATLQPRKAEGPNTKLVEEFNVLALEAYFEFSVLA